MADMEGLETVSRATYTLGIGESIPSHGTFRIDSLSWIAYLVHSTKGSSCVCKAVMFPIDNAEYPAHSD